MIDLILNATFVEIALGAAVILLPAIGYGLYRWQPTPHQKRMSILIGALGPFAWIYWRFHQLVLGTLGFDSVISVVVIVGVATVIGFGAGWWANRPLVKDWSESDEVVVPEEESAEVEDF